MVGLIGAIVAFVVQPVAAALSDYTRSRLGRRRPWILVGHRARRALPGRARQRPDLPGAGLPHHPAPVLEQPRPGSLPGLRPGPRAREPGGHRVRAGGHHVGRRAARRRRASAARRGPARSVAGLPGLRRAGGRRPCCRPCSASPRVRSRCPSAAAPSATASAVRCARRGSTAASCGCWPAASSSS